MKPKGLTLGEVLVALAVASVAILTLAMMVGAVRRAQVDGKVSAAGSSLARKVVERLRSDATFFNKVAQIQPYQMDETWVVDPAQPAWLFHANVALKPLSAAVPPRYYDVSVSVSWEQDHHTRQLGLETYLAVP